MDFNYNNGIPYGGTTAGMPLGLGLAVAREGFNNEGLDGGAEGNHYVKLTEAEKDKLVAKAESAKTREEKDHIIQSVVENEIWPKAEVNDMMGRNGLLDDSVTM